MKNHVPLILLPLSLATAFGQTTPQRRPHPAPPACLAITSEMLSQPLVLPAGCYTVNRFTTVASNLTISPGTTITFAGGTELSVESNASLEAVGTADKPIILRGTDGAAGSWSGLSISSRSSHNHLSYVTLEDAGVKGSDNAAIVLAPGSQLAIDHSTIKRSLGTGIYVMDNAIFTHFEANHFANTDVPLRIKASDIVMIDPATTFTDNKNNVIFIPHGEGKVDEDALWRKLAVPYRFDASLNVEAKLTIEAGTQLQFRENVSLDVESNGSLTAIGTPSEPIIFTGTDDTEGYWSGIFFESASSSNILRHVDIRFSGSKSGAVGGGIGITHRASAIVQSSAIASCPTGIYIYSEGTLNLDAATSNRFVDVDRNIFLEP
jgi:nitrous oxidase accessory protein NosD